MNTVAYQVDTVGSRIAKWLGLTVLAVVTFYSALLIGLFIYLSDGAQPVALCLGYHALLGASGLLFLGSFVPLFWRAPIGAVKFGIVYLVVLGVIVVTRVVG